MTRFVSILLVQLLAIPVAIFAFKYIEIRFFASAVAGAYFILSSVIVLTIVFRSRDELFRSPIWNSTLGFLVLFALPIFLGRMVYPPDTPFSEITILGISGPLLHKSSTIYFMGMVGFTFIEAFLWWKNKKTLVTNEG